MSRANLRSVGRPTAFTLIELLVVISIIALLISILLPSLSGARKAGRALKCQSHLRTLGQGMRLYADFYDDFIALSESGQLDGSMHYAAALLPTLDGGSMNRGGPFSVTGPGGNHDDFLRRLRQTAAFQCPDFPDERQALDFVVNGFRQPYRGNVDPGPAGTGPVGQGGGAPHRREFANLSDFDQPTSRIIYLAEGHRNLPTGSVRLHDLFSPLQLPFGALPRIASDLRHPGGINILFFDGHVDRMQNRTIDPGFPRPLPERLRWIARVAP